MSKQAGKGWRAERRDAVWTGPSHCRVSREAEVHLFLQGEAGKPGKSGERGPPGPQVKPHLPQPQNSLFCSSSSVNSLPK